MGALKSWKVEQLLRRAKDTRYWITLVKAREGKIEIALIRGKAESWI